MKPPSEKTNSNPEFGYVNPEFCKRATSRISEQVSPAEIAKELKISTGEAIRLLYIAIGEDLIRESDVFWVLVKKYKEEAAWLNGYCTRPQKQLRVALAAVFPEADLDELILLCSCIKRRVYIGEMYLFLTDVERTLHRKIKELLIAKFGEKESGWWKKGVPDPVRINCAQAREFDDESVDHPYHFTTFIHLKKIMENKWKDVSPHLPQAVSIEKKDDFLTDMTRLNSIRNQVMHPVRGELPTEKDFEFVREMHRKLDASLWR